MKRPQSSQTALMRQLAEDIKSGAIRSKSGEGFFVLKGEYYDAIAAGRKTTEYRDLTPRNLSLSIGIKTVKLQRGYGHHGQPPEQMRYEVKSVTLMDASDRECDPYAIPPGFLATTIAIHLEDWIEGFIRCDNFAIRERVTFLNLAFREKRQFLNLAFRDSALAFSSEIWYHITEKNREKEARE